MGDQAPSSQAGLLKKHGLSEPTHFGLSFPIYSRNSKRWEVKPSNREQGLKPQPAMFPSRQAACGSWTVCESFCSGCA